MITCLGLVVGIVESAFPQDVLNQCAKWVKQYPHLLECDLEFIINGMVYATVKDAYIENDEVFLYCKLYNELVGIGMSK